jgi:hypothetical protein
LRISLACDKLRAALSKIKRKKALKHYFITFGCMKEEQKKVQKAEAFKRDMRKYRQKLMLRKMRQVLKIEQKWLRKVIKEFEFTRLEHKWADWINYIKMQKAVKKRERNLKKRIFENMS